MPKKIDLHGVVTRRLTLMDERSIGQLILPKPEALANVPWPVRFLPASPPPTPGDQTRNALDTGGVCCFCNDPTGLTEEDEGNQFDLDLDRAWACWAAYSFLYEAHIYKASRCSTSIQFSQSPSAQGLPPPRRAISPRRSSPRLAAGAGAAAVAQWPHPHEFMMIE